MMWMARTGAQWRRLPSEDGTWNSVFRRYRRWVETGVFDALLETLAELAGRDRSAVYDRQHGGAGPPLRRWGRKGAGPSEALGRSRGGFSTGLRARCEARGLPLGFVLTPGQAHDIQGFGQLFRMIDGRALMQLADRSDDADAVRAESQPYYTWRNRIERMFNKLKNWRRVATRYVKTIASYLGFVSIASGLLWISFVHGR